jgi:large subunit ribosomal protein L10
VYGKGSGPDIARALMDAKKADEKLELRGIFFDGEAYAGEDGVKKVSKFPTRQEAIATVVAAMLSPGKKLAGAVKGQPGKVAALIKAVEEKAKEKEAAAPAAAPAA